MAYRILASVVALLIAVGCGESSTGKKLEGIEASKEADKAPAPDNPLDKKIAEAENISKTIVEKKEEVKKAPLAEEYFLLTPAFEATGYQVQTLKRKLSDTEKVGQSYVKLRSYAGIPEQATLYDQNNRLTTIVNYLWKWGEGKEATPVVVGAVQLNEREVMSAPFPIFYYCETEGSLIVHMSTARHVNATHLRKVEIQEGTVVVAYMTATDAKGKVAVWPDTCKDLEPYQAAPQPYEIYGIHKQIIGFDSEGNLARIENQDKEGKLVEDLYGRAKLEQGWKEGKLVDEAWYDRDGLVGRYVYTFNDRGQLVKKASVDAQGKAHKDYFGAASYEYTYDAKNRISKEIRADETGAPYESHEYEYGRMQQIAVHRVFDGQGTLNTTYVHEFNDKGSRVSLTTFEGDPKDGKLKLDYNKVALYRFAYNDKGEVLEMSRHSNVAITTPEGKQDYALTNALDGWAVTRYSYLKEAVKEKVKQGEEEVERVVRRAGELDSVSIIKVDAMGNPVWEELTDAEGNQSRIERKYQDSALISYTKTTLEDDMPTKTVHYDAQNNITAVAMFKTNEDARPLETAYFAADEKTAIKGPDGFHKEVREYSDYGLLVKKTEFDEAGTVIKGVEFEYDQGKLKGKKEFGPAPAQ